MLLLAGISRTSTPLEERLRVAQREPASIFLPQRQIMGDARLLRKYQSERQDS